MRLNKLGKPVDAGASPERLAALTSISTKMLDADIQDAARQIDKIDRDRKSALDNARKADRKAVEVAWQLGQKLNQRKALTAHGEWEPYLEGMSIGRRNASNYMRIASEIGSASDLGPSIRATLKQIRQQKEPPHPVTGQPLSGPMPETVDACHSMIRELRSKVNEMAKTIQTLKLDLDMETAK